ncbi:MAG: COR domain-containing protein, partial [Bacteroidota bacterium]
MPTPTALPKQLQDTLSPLPKGNTPADCLRADFTGYYAINAAGEIVGLNLRGQQLTQPTAWLADLEKLEFLNLSDCGLSTFTLPELPFLRALTLSDNPQLQNLQLPAKLPELLRADLARCGLTAVHWPHTPKLEWLDISYGRADTLDWTFRTACPALEFMYARRTKMRALLFPAGFDALRYLYLRKCGLEELDFKVARPKSAAMPQLEVLDLQENNLKSIPGLAYPSLTALYVKDNPLENYSEADIAGDNSGNSKSIITQLQNIARTGVTQNHRVKLVVVGNGRVGKTTLVRMLRGEAFNEKQPFTHGIDLLRLGREHFPQAKPELEDLDVMVWDFGGQEIYYAIHQFFLSEEAIYLYVWTDKDIAYKNFEQDAPEQKAPLLGDDYDKWRDHPTWLANIRMHGLKSPILPVKTHCGKAKPIYDFPFLEYQQPPFEIKQPPLEFEAQEGYDYTLKNIRNQISLLLDKHPLLGSEISVGIDLLIREDLVNERGRLKTQGNELLEISRDRVQELASKRDIADKNIEGLLDYLRNIGEIVYYPHLPDLEDRIFLDAGILTERVYQLLDPRIIQAGATNPLKDKGGVFDREFARSSLGDTYETLLLLLQEFKLIYRQEVEGKELFYSPQHLPMLQQATRQRKNAFKGCKRGLALRFELHYPHFLPENVMVNTLSNYGPYAGEVVYQDAIYFEPIQATFGAAIQLIEEDGQKYIQVHTPPGVEGDALAVVIYQEIKKLGKKAKLHIADGASRKWVDSLALEEALKDDLSLRTVKHKPLEPTAFAWYLQQNRGGEMGELPPKFDHDNFEVSRKQKPTNTSPNSESIQVIYDLIKRARTREALEKLLSITSGADHKEVLNLLNL